MAEKKEEILHIFVIGFHHKKGCQIEFSYPEVKTLPEPWKPLTSLAMPDGAHNYDSDSVYFHLPSLDDKYRTVFGVSCFKQIPIEKVKIKTSDMTRGAVQKALCVLSTVPLYGYLQIKMDLVTAAFFEGDFSEVSLLKDTFHHLNGCLPVSHLQHLHDGLSVRDLIHRFRHRTVILFKLLLLEKKVVFFHSPVKPLCCCLISLISLLPGVVESGLFESTSVRYSGSDKNANTNIHNQQKDEETQLEVSECNEAVQVETVEVKSKCLVENCLSKGSEAGECDETDCDRIVKAIAENQNCVENENVIAKGKESDSTIETSVEEGVDIYFMDDYFNDLKSLENSQLEFTKSGESCSGDCGTFNCDLAFVANLNLESYALPLSIFTEGNLCLPYVSISYLDFLAGENVRGFTAGAANVLFKQKSQLADVLIELDGTKIETRCPELRRQLLLTTEDLRFGEQLIKGLDLDSGENGDEWFRSQFTLYLISLLRTSLLQDGNKEVDHFNSQFVNAWKNTRNYKKWCEADHSAILEINPGHPCAGNLSVADMRLRISQVMSSSESGRRINQAVTTTGKAVGGAIVQAKGAFTHWWSSLTTSETKTGKSVENI
ncbi:hypothetical protein RUM43_002931 [Polyplax serrata]|uniref:UDENN domain-containing protein n=1 Tax=Polyplax serrata TaxID=468196 RepID=A0AAN8NUE8_POLSC